MMTRGRSVRLAAALCVLGAAGVAGAQAPARPDLQGVWWNASPEPALKPLGGGPIPYTAAGLAAAKANAAAIGARAAKPKARDDMIMCLPAGPTRILLQPFPLQIVQKDDLLVLIFEHNHVYEAVRVGKVAKPDPDADPRYMGIAAARWTKDGVVETLTSFNDQTLLDDAGAPHGEKLTVKREIRRVEDGRALEITSTIADSEMYTKPWMVRQTFRQRQNTRIEEYICGQGPIETRYTRAALQ